MLIQEGKTNWVLIFVVALVAVATGVYLLVYFGGMSREQETLNAVSQLNKPAAVDNGTAAPKELVPGGGCSYDSFNGTCTITSVSAYSAPDFPGQDGYNVDFTFKLDPAENLTSDWFTLKDPQTGKIEFAPNNTTYLSAPSECVAKYGIAVRKTFNCQLQIENAGSCTPVMYKFPFGTECLVY